MNNAHRLARTTPHGRALMVRRIEQEGWTAVRVAEAFGISERTVREWLASWRAEGAAGLEKRSSRPARSPAAWPTLGWRWRRGCG